MKKHVVEGAEAIGLLEVLHGGLGTAANKTAVDG
jgi:hypothetical protein